MNRQLFLQLLEHPDSVSEKENIALQKFTEDFPYCQTGQLLFVKYLHSQQSVHYPEQLKVAAAYAPDRKVLYNLIHATPSPTLPQRGREIVLTEDSQEEVFSEPLTENKIEETVEERPERLPAEIIPEKEIEEHISQADIIQKRLEEIAALKASPLTPLQRRGESAPTKSIEEEIPKSEIKPVPEIIAPVEVEPEKEKELKSEPVSFKEEKQTRQPEIIQPAKQEEKEEDPKSGKHSFTEWLKTVRKESPITKEPITNPNEQNEKSSASSDEIIDRFIETEPRIIPSKAEFYNPIKMAKQSLEEHDDLISETLAGVFAEQGNFPRAIEMYRKLMLAIPEKSSFFAARIEKLTQQLNGGK